VNHDVSQLRYVPAWFFSSGPLDDFAEREAISAATQVPMGFLAVQRSRWGWKKFQESRQGEPVEVESFGTECQNGNPNSTEEE
jgi:hypothetical protein